MARHWVNRYKRISTHALREEGDGRTHDRTRRHRISTHALREEGDSCLATGLKRVPNFYPRPPRGGRPFSPPAAPVPHRDFYPRPPRGGRRSNERPACAPAYFYPRPPRGGRHKARPRVEIEIIISTHALREEGDLIQWLTGVGCGGISTHALREEGDGGRLYAGILHPPISTHALREEGDGTDSQTGTDHRHFYPRPPRGGRQLHVRLLPPSSIFLPTPSARRATLRHGCRSSPPEHFYPRPPRGGRPPTLDEVAAYCNISTHALREEGDR